MRAKLKIANIAGSGDYQTLRFSAVCKPQFDATGLDEDNTFSRYTPQADLQMTITNPALVGKFNVGDVFYVDFTKVEPA